ncbi:MAG: D-alanyl-D-alanine carboxypeptidase [Clostridium sp.]|nr:D-alanyl-D-alanine carboxypeptidase [Clostridium sp.]
MQIRMFGQRTIRGFFYGLFAAAGICALTALGWAGVWTDKKTAASGDAAEADREWLVLSEDGRVQRSNRMTAADNAGASSGWAAAREQAQTDGQMEIQAQGAAESAELSLYATAAVLIDADSGRVLYGKNEDTPLAMASTTKIMTCITVLEHVEDLGEMLTVSSYAASMPKVKLYIKKGEQYQVRELLFSLMLESHNDAAVALAEYVGKQYLEDELRVKDTADFSTEESKQAVAAFAALMNAKADALECRDTYFITPNGLDATETIVFDNGESVVREHHTTASDLARIMAYCITESSKRDLFLEITRTASYSFYRNGRNFTCNNHNSFLGMMEGALSGKTGFTNKAGYCYVGALCRGERTFVVALLACGWPNNKSYKWSDTKELMEYGLKYYDYREFSPEVAWGSLYVANGAAKDGNPYHSVSVPIVRKEKEEPIRLLVREEENVIAKLTCKESLPAPVTEGTQVGTITYYLVDASGKENYLKEEGLYTGEGAGEKNFSFVAGDIFGSYLILRK